MHGQRSHTSCLACCDVYHASGSGVRSHRGTASWSTSCVPPHTMRSIHLVRCTPRIRSFRPRRLDHRSKENTTCVVVFPHECNDEFVTSLHTMESGGHPSWCIWNKNKVHLVPWERRRERRREWGRGKGGASWGEGGCVWWGGVRMDGSLQPTILKQVGGYMHGIGNVQTRVDACTNEGKKDKDVILHVEECFLGKREDPNLWMQPTQQVCWS